MKIREIREIIEKNQGEHLKEYLTPEGKELIEKMENDDKNILKKEHKLRSFQRLVLYIFIVFFIIWLLFYFVVGLTSVPNNDMYPAFHNNDVVIYDKFSKHPGINDVIVFDKNGTTYLGRVVAKEGDIIEILEKGGIIVNGSKVTEEKITESTIALTTVAYPLTLENDEYFVLVDARETGEDSRYFGPIKRNNIKGRASMLFRRMGL